MGQLFLWVSGSFVTSSESLPPLGSNNQANLAFHPFMVGKWVVIHVITWITRVETIKRQTRAACGCLAARLQARVCGLSLQPIGCTPASFVTQSAAAASVCELWRYVSVGPLPFYRQPSFFSRCPPLISGLRRLTMSSQHHKSIRSGIIGRPFCSRDFSAVSISVDLVYRPL